MFELDIRKLDAGCHIGGNKGAVVMCPVCKLPACLVKRTCKRDDIVKHYAHTVSVSVGSSKADYGNICKHKEQRY